MAFCTKCGSQVNDDSKFCGACGNPITIAKKTQNETRKTVYDGVIHKCPNCGTALGSFVKNCPECGYEIRDTSATKSANDFANEYALLKSNDKKIDLIRTFVIPNTKEDILEFVVLASSNINISSYSKENVVISGGYSQEDVTEAWMAKFEQAYQKAALLIPDTPEFQRIEKLYLHKKHELGKGKNSARLAKAWKWIVLIIIIAFSLIMFALSAENVGFMIAGLYGFIAAMLFGMMVFKK